MAAHWLRKKDWISFVVEPILDPKTSVGVRHSPQQNVPVRKGIPSQLPVLESENCCQQKNSVHEVVNGVGVGDGDGVGVGVGDGTEN